VSNPGSKLITDNRRARHDYHLLERVEAGIALTGTEVKSLREGRATLAQAFAEVRDGEAWLLGAEIAIYDQGNRANHEPTRAREVFDVSGAGDTVIGVLALMVACGADLPAAMRVANHAAGIVVGKLGTAVVHRGELAASFAPPA